MRTAVFCPIGPLDRFGYQYNYAVILENLYAFADRLYVYSSTRQQIPMQPLLDRFPNMVYISDETTWFEQDANGVEIFQMNQMLRVANQIAERIQSDGLDCALHIHINQYVPRRAAENLRQFCQQMLDANQPFAWLYKRYQIGNCLFHADCRVPWILNLHAQPLYSIQADSLHSPDGATRYTIQHEDFREMDKVAIVDCPMETTIQDLENVKRFTRYYSELNPQASTDFDPEAYLKYYANKFSAKTISKEPLDETGQAVLRNSRSDFICWDILQRYRSPGFKRRMISFLRRVLRSARL